MDFRKRFGKPFLKTFGKILYLALLSIAPEYARLEHYYYLYSFRQATPRYSVPMINTRQRIDKTYKLPKQTRPQKTKIIEGPPIRLPVFIISRC